MDMAGTTFTFVGGLALRCPGTSNRQKGRRGAGRSSPTASRCGKDSRAAVYISRAVACGHHRVLRFGFAGTGISGGTGNL